MVGIMATAEPVTSTLPELVMTQFSDACMRHYGGLPKQYSGLPNVGVMRIRLEQACNKST